MKPKKIFFVLIAVSIIIAAIIYGEKIINYKMAKSPIEFLYINESTLDSLLKEFPLKPQKINSFILEKGLSFKISHNFYDEFILKNQRVNLRFLHMILNENADIENPESEKSICVVDRDVPMFLLSQINQTHFQSSSKQEIVDFSEFVNKLKSNKVYTLISYSKKEGWFDYDSTKKENKKMKNETDKIINSLKK